MIDIKAPSKIASLEMFWCSVSVKASIVMNIDIVKPMPARAPMPNTCNKLVPAGCSPQPILMVVQEKSKMPKGFPMTNPAKIPQLNEEVRDSNKLPGMTIAVLANANNGSMIKLTMSCSLCS
jgi:hypothetical protein